MTGQERWPCATSCRWLDIWDRASSRIPCVGRADLLIAGMRGACHVKGGILYCPSRLTPSLRLLTLPCRLNQSLWISTCYDLFGILPYRTTDDLLTLPETRHPRMNAARQHRLRRMQWTSIMRALLRPHVQKTVRTSECGTLLV